ncbi:MAG: twin-arginine translocase subunit TatC [Planctomycetaceae bacterium]|nr:twin-arginine translocase subunit TatC [Planctomycetaceae bacterium]
MPQTNDDLFQDSRMTFGEHLEELRSTFVKALLSLLVGILASLYFTPSVVQFLQTPVERAIRDFRVKKARIDLEKQYGYVPDEMAFLLSEYGLVPNQVRVNPADMLRMLQAYRPEEFTRPIDDLEFTGLNLLVENVRAVSGRIVSEDDSLDSETRLVLDAVRRHLAAEDLAALKQISATEDGELGAPQQIQVLAILNRLIKSDALGQDSTLEPLFAAQEIGWLEQFWNAFWMIDSTENPLVKIREAYQANSEQRLLHRLNRTLVERYVFPTPPPSPFLTLTIWQQTQASTVALGAGEGFMIYLKASLLTGTIVAGPFIFYFLWTFVAAGLYPQEQRYVYFYLPFSLALFGAGVMVAFIFAFEPVLQFLFSFNLLLGIDPQPRIGEWLSFVMLVPLGFGVAFQLPLVMLLLFRIGIISVETYVSQWRMAMLLIAIISMLATPADPISMFLLGGPLVLLYVFGIFLCRWLPVNKRVFPEGYDPV